MSRLRLRIETLESRRVLAVVPLSLQQPIVQADHAGPTHVVLADLDGDNDLDVLSTSFYDDRVAWYENLDGQGSFGDQRVIADSADGAEMPHAADLDGDGDLDVAVVTQLGQDRVSWYENQDGLGTFGDEQIVSDTVVLGSSVASADLDGDGDLDLISTSSDEIDSDVSWYENLDGQGSFGPRRVVTADASVPLATAVADLDGDGDVDIVSASYLDDQIAWYENVGVDEEVPDRFGTMQSIGRLPAASEVIVADLDGDGRTDVIAGNSQYQAGSIVWFRNQGGGRFADPQTITEQVDGVIDMQVADLDGDGDVDLLSASVYDGVAAWYENADGLGNFSGQNLLLAVGDGMTAVDAGDLNGDGLIDVAITSFVDDWVDWIPQVADKQFGDPIGISQLGVTGIESLASADLDSDGDVDLAVAGVLDNSVSWVENLDGAGTWSDLRIVDDQTLGPVSIDTADLNGDGFQDILVAAATEGRVVWYANDGAGFFSDRRTIATDVTGTEEAAAADLDGDGDLDVIATATGTYNDAPSAVYWYENVDGQGMFGAPRSIDSDLLAPRQVAVADFDDDEDLDIAIGFWDSNRIVWFENVDGAGRFSDPQTVAPEISLPLAVLAGDVDGDGDTDLLSAGFVDNGVYWYENSGNGQFTERVIESNGSAGPEGLDLADLDNDGDLDVFVTTTVEDDLVWYENLDGEGTFGDRRVIHDNLLGASDVVVVDVDGDGAQDVIASAYNLSRVIWYRNELIDQADWNNDSQLSADDIDLLCAAIAGDENPSEFDLTGEGLVNSSDYNRLIRDIFKTSLGDANLDGLFDSSDLVQVFAAGHYDTGVGDGVGWAAGDWNCDGQFDSGDLVAAFSQGEYVG